MHGTTNVNLRKKNCSPTENLMKVRQP